MNKKSFLEKKIEEADKEEEKIMALAKGFRIAKLSTSLTSLVSVIAGEIALSISNGSIAIAGLTAAGAGTLATVSAVAVIAGCALVPVTIGFSITFYVLMRKKKKNTIEIFTPIVLKLILSIMLKKEDSLGEKFKQLKTLIKTNSSHIKPISKFDMDNLIQKSIQNDLPKFQKETNEARFNIMVLGKSGVGKSTLINAVLKKNVAKTGAGYQMTQNLSYYENNFLRLYDSRGIQISGYTLKESSQEILDTIEALSKKELDKHIHAIWYCFRGKRFEKEEVEYCRNLLNAYSVKKLPIFIVETNSINEEDSEEMEKIIKKDLRNDKISYFPVMAMETKTRRGVVIPTFGVDELVHESLKKAEEAVDSSFYNLIQTCITSLFLSRTISQGITDSEDLLTKEMFEVIKNKKKQEEIFTSYKNVFKSMIEKYYVTGKEPRDYYLQNQKELDAIFYIINTWNEEYFQDSLNSFNSQQFEIILRETKEIFREACKKNYSTEKEINYYVGIVENDVFKDLRKNNSSTFYSLFFYLLALSFCEGICISALKTFKQSSDPIINTYIKHSVEDYIHNIKTKYENSK